MNTPLDWDFVDDAKADITEIGLYFAERDRNVEDRFYQALDKTVRVLCRSPNIGERCHFRNPRTKGMRMWLISGFSNYLIFYRVQGNILQILRVIHGARDNAAMFDGEHS